MARFYFSAWLFALLMLPLSSGAVSPPGKTQSWVKKTPAKNAKRFSIKKITALSDEMSYQDRGILKSQFSGVNQFEGNTYSMLKESLSADFNDALIGFLSFDQRGGLRENVVYRANGTRQIKLYNAKTGMVLKTKTEAVQPDSTIMAGGMTLIKGTTFEKLLAQSLAAPTPNKIHITDSIVPGNHLSITPASP